MINCIVLNLLRVLPYDFNTVSFVYELCYTVCWLSKSLKLPKITPKKNLQYDGCRGHFKAYVCTMQTISVRKMNKRRVFLTYWIHAQHYVVGEKCRFVPSISAIWMNLSRIDIDSLSCSIRSCKWFWDLEKVVSQWVLCGVRMTIQLSWVDRHHLSTYCTT